MKRMPKKVRVIVVTILNICFFTSVSLLLSYAYKNESRRSVDKMSSVYLEEISSQTVQNFETNLDNEFAKINTTINSLENNSSITTLSAMREYMYKVKATNDFSHLGFVDTKGFSYSTTTGGISLIPSLDDMADLLDSTEYFISYNETVWPDDTLLLGVGFENAITITDDESGNGESIDIKALIVGVNAATIGEKLSLHKEGLNSYSSIVDKDGSFVVSSDEDHVKFGSNLLVSVEQNGRFDQGYQFGDLSKNIDDYKSGITSYRIGNYHEYMFYAPIPNVDWYLVTFMSFSVVNAQVESLTNYLTFVASAIIILIVVVGISSFLSISRKDKKYQQLLLTERNNAIKANEYKSNFLSQISHEIRTPMNGILGMTAVASKYLEDPERISHCLDKIELSSRYLLNLINDVLDMSKIESGKTEIVNNFFDFNKLLKSLNTVFYHQAQNKEVVLNIFIFNCEYEYLLGDELRLNQILTNLLSNAVKFTPSGGHVQLDITTKRRDFTEVTIEFRVTDSGIGIAPENQERIFEAFTQENAGITAKYGGTGLGLPITKSFIEKMGGTIRVESEVGKGSTFIVELPFGYKNEEPEALDVGGEKVLLVTPYDMSGTNLINHLKAYNFDVTKVDDFSREILDTIDDYYIAIVDSAFSYKYDEIKDALDNSNTNVVILGQDIDCVDDAKQYLNVRGYLARPLFQSDIIKMLNLINSQKETKASSISLKDILKDKHVLIVEDNEINLEISIELLQDAGTIIDIARNGLQAVDKFMTSPPDYYDIILMDIRMPVMDGYSATTKIRGSKRLDSSTVVIIAMTANSFVDDVKKSMECGMDAHVTKPFEVEQIYKAYIEVIENRGGV